MGVFGLLSHCLRAEIGTEVDLFKVAKQKGGIELLIDFRSFLFVVVKHSCSYLQLHQSDPCWSADDVTYLGGEYHIIKKLVTNFCTSLRKHNITPVFFDDGPRGSDPDQFTNKLDTWKARHEGSVKLSRHLADYLQNLGSLESVKTSQLLPWLAKDQVKTALRACLSMYGGKYTVCLGEADDIMVQYLRDTDRAYAILANDSDFLVMKGSRFIPECEFEWESVWSEDSDQCLVTVYTPREVMDSLKISSHSELVDIAILTGNDFTRPLIQHIWGTEWTELKEVVKWYRHNVEEGQGLDHCTKFTDIVANHPSLVEAIKYSRRFYNLEDVHRQEVNPDEWSALKRFIMREIENFNLPSVSLAWCSGVHWGGCLLEDHTMPSIDHWTQPLTTFLYTLCTQEKTINVLSRSNQRMLDQQQIPLKHYSWLPKVSQVPMLDDESRWKLFDRIVGYLESPVEHAVKEDIYNGLALHSFFQGYGAHAGFLIHAINLLISLSYVHKYHVHTWEYVAILATGLYCVSKDTDKIKFDPTWKKPTMRCITLGNWYQHLVKLLCQLSRLLRISDHSPTPDQTYQGSYFTSLYMTVSEKVNSPKHYWQVADLDLKYLGYQTTHPLMRRITKVLTSLFMTVSEKGISQDYIDPSVLETLNHIIEENHLLDEVTKQMMKQELCFIEHLDPSAGYDDSENEEDLDVAWNYSQAPVALPIEAHRERILEHINSHRVTCIEGETGSGKSTRVPQFILQQYTQHKNAEMDMPSPRIIVTQPRRLAAKSLASRVASELGEKDVGKSVQYKRGQDHFFSDRTQIYYVTTSYMIELLVHNPRKFDWFTHVILDEIHERDLDADLMSLIVHILMKTYTQPKIIIMSATLQAKLFVRYFSDITPCHPTQHLKVGVRSNHRVQEMYIEDLVEVYAGALSTDAQVQLVKLFCQLKGIPISTLMSARYKQKDPQDRSDMTKMRAVASQLILSGALCDKEIREKPRERVMLSKYMEVNVPLIKALAKAGETILMFLPGRKDIDELYDLLAPYQNTDGSKPEGWSCNIALFILHSSIPFEDQQQCFQTPDSRTCHVILATNIAESSLTLPRVTVVIDLGMRRHLVYDLKKRVRCLYTGWCSQASMKQRKGRTGRVCDGVCIRLMTREHFNKQREFDEPQMTIAPLDKLLLQVKYVGKHIAPDKRPSELLLQEAVEPPNVDNIEAAVKNLADIGAITAADECADMTLLGQIAMHLPLDLNLCRLIFYGCLFHCPCDAVVMAATLQAQDPFTLPSKKIMKDQEKFISSIRNSFHRRKSFDNNCYSEPIMCRNMYKAWLRKTSELINRDADSTEFRSQAHRAPKQEDIRKLREEFCNKQSIMGKRLCVIESLVADVAQNVLKCLPRLSENYHKLEELMSIVPKRGRRSLGAMQGGIQGLYRLEDLFSADVLLLNTILAAALSPSFVYGSVQQESDPRSKDKTPKSLKLERSMVKSGVDPSRSVCIPDPPKPFLKKEASVETMLEDIVRCISLVDRPPTTNKKGRPKKPPPNKFNLGYLSDKELFIEYVIPRSITQSTTPGDLKHEITSELPDCVHYPYQFSEAPSGPRFYMDLPTKQAIARNSGERAIRVSMPQNPFRIEWSMMSSDGVSLKDKDRACKAICGWRNPIGFSCDVKKRLHFGVTSKFTKAKNYPVGWADGISLFPVYQDNLFSVVLMLTFMPQQHGVVFTVDTGAMNITQIEMFKYQIPVSARYPLTLSLLRLINEIRSEISEIFVNAEASIHRQIPESNIRGIYQRLTTYMEQQEFSKKKPRHSKVPQSTAEGRTSMLQNIRQNQHTTSESSFFGGNRFGTLTSFFEDNDIDDNNEQSEHFNLETSNQNMDISSENVDIMDYQLADFIRVNAFDVGANMSTDRTEGIWRQKGAAGNLQQLDNLADQKPVFRYLLPYDVRVFDKAYLAQFYGTHQGELLRLEMESSDGYDSEYEDSDHDDMDYIYTSPYQNPHLLKESLKARIIAMLNEKTTPIRLSDLLKQDAIKDTIGQLNEQSPGSHFELGQFIENSDGDFVIADINSRHRVVCLQNSMGKTLAKLIEDKEKAEEYILSTVYCVLLEVRNEPQEIVFLSKQLKTCIKQTNQANEDTEILANLLNDHDEVFQLLLPDDDKEKVKIKDAVFQKIIRSSPQGLKSTDAPEKEATLHFSTAQKIEVREILFEHLLSNQNLPISFQEIANLNKVQQVIAKALKNQNTFLADQKSCVNLGKIFQKSSSSWFEVVGNSVRLLDEVYKKNYGLAKTVDVDNHIDSKDESNEPPSKWEEIDCKDVTGDDIWSIDSTKKHSKTNINIVNLEGLNSAGSKIQSMDKVLTYNRTASFHEKVPKVVSKEHKCDEIKFMRPVSQESSHTDLSLVCSSDGNGSLTGISKETKHVKVSKQQKKKSNKCSEAEQAFITAVSEYCSEKPIVLKLLQKKPEVKQLWQQVLAEGKYTDMEIILSEKLKVIKNQQGVTRVLDTKGMTRNNLQKAKDSLEKSIVAVFQLNHCEPMALNEVLDYSDVEEKWNHLNKLQKLDAVPYFSMLNEFSVVKDGEGCLWLSWVYGKPYARNDDCESLNHDLVQSDSEYYSLSEDEESGCEYSSSGEDDDSEESPDEVIQTVIGQYGGYAELKDIVTDGDVIDAWLRTTESDEYDEGQITAHIANSGHFMFVEDTSHKIWVIKQQDKDDWETKVLFDKQFLKFCFTKGPGWLKLDDILTESGLYDQWMIIKELFVEDSFDTYLACSTCLQPIIDKEGTSWIIVTDTASKSNFDTISKTSAGAEASKKSKEIGNESSNFEVDYIEKNFVSAVEEYLLTLPGKQCLKASLPLNPNVKDAWECVKQQVKPKPTMKDIFAKYQDKFLEGVSDKNAATVKLRTKPSKKQHHQQSNSSQPLKETPSSSQLGASAEIASDRKSTKADVKLTAQILNVFKISQSTLLALNEIEKTEVIDQWKIVRDEGYFDRFIDFLQENTKHFNTSKSSNGKWTISLVASEQKHSKSHENVVWRNSTNSKPNEVGVVWGNLSNTQPSEVGFVLGNPTKTNVPVDTSGMSFKEALLLPPCPQPPLRNASSLLLIPTSNDKINPVPSFAERQLISELIAVFQAKLASQLELRDFQIPSVTDKWKVVKSEDKYEKFIDFISKCDDHFEAYRVEGSDWQIKLLNQVKKRSTADVTRNPAIGSEHPKPMGDMVSNSQPYQKPVSFKDALLSQPPAAMPLRKAESMMNLPTSTPTSVPNAIAHTAFVDAVRGVFKVHKTRTLLLKDVQNPGEVQQKWKNVINQGNKMKFTDYLMTYCDGIGVRLDKDHGWIVTLKKTQSSRMDVPKISQNISNTQAFASTKPKSTLVNPPLKPQKSSGKIDLQAEMIKGYIEGNFVSSVQEFLQNRPENECLLSQLALEHVSVKNAWECCTQQINPQPTLKEVLKKYTSAFTLYSNENNQDVVQLCYGSIQKAKDKTVHQKGININPEQSQVGTEKVINATNVGINFTGKKVESGININADQSKVGAIKVTRNDNNIEEKELVVEKGSETRKKPVIGTENRQQGIQDVFSALPDISILASSWSHHFSGAGNLDSTRPNDGILSSTSSVLAERSAPQSRSSSISETDCMIRSPDKNKENIKQDKQDHTNLRGSIDREKLPSESIVPTSSVGAKGVVMFPSKADVKSPTRTDVMSTTSTDVMSPCRTDVMSPTKTDVMSPTRYDVMSPTRTEVMSPTRTSDSQVMWSPSNNVASPASSASSVSDNDFHSAQNTPERSQIVNYGGSPLFTNTRLWPNEKLQANPVLANTSLSPNGKPQGNPSFAYTSLSPNGKEQGGNPLVTGFSAIENISTSTYPMIIGGQKCQQMPSQLPMDQPYPKVYPPLGAVPIITPFMQQASSALPANLDYQNTAANIPASITSSQLPNIQPHRSQLGSVDSVTIGKTSALLAQNPNYLPPSIIQAESAQRLAHAVSSGVRNTGTNPLIGDNLVRLTDSNHQPAVRKTCLAQNQPASVPNVAPVHNFQNVSAQAPTNQQLFPGQPKTAQSRPNVGYVAPVHNPQYVSISAPAIHPVAHVQVKHTPQSHLSTSPGINQSQSIRQGFTQSHQEMDKPESNKPELPTAAEVEVMGQAELASGLLDLQAVMQDFCTEHNLKPVETIIATFGSNFLCNANLNGKTIGEGYGNSREHATYYALYNAFAWMKQIFG